MSKTVFHEASRTWLSAACAKQLDAALAAAREAGRSAGPHANDNGIWRTTPNSLLSGEPWNFITGKRAGALERLDRIKTKLGDVAHIFVGLQTSDDNVFVVPLDSEIERNLTRPFLLTGDLSAYTTPQAVARIIFPYEIIKAQSTNLRGGYIKFSKQYIETDPVIPPEQARAENVDRMVLLVERMLDLNKKKAAEKNPNILEQLETQISATDRQIDRLVYELYALTPEEIAIVEGNAT